MKGVVFHTSARMMTAMACHLSVSGAAFPSIDDR